MTAPTRAETIAHGAAGHRRGEGCCSLPGKAKSGLVPDAVNPESMNWISGGNFLVAETGSVVLVTNEGNATLTTTLPKVHVVISGIEKVVPTFEDVSILLRLLTR